MNPDEADEGQGRTLADELLPDLVMLAISLGVQLGALLLLAKRDALTRAWMRLQALVSAQRTRERHEVTVAQFRAELAAWEHEQAGR